MVSIPCLLNFLKSSSTFRLSCVNDEIKLTKPEFDLGDWSSTVDGSLRWWRLLPEQGNYQKIDQRKKKEILGENEKQLHKYIKDV